VFLIFLLITLYTLSLVTSSSTLSHPSALLFSFFIVVFVAVFTIVTNLRPFASLLVVNSAFLFLIISGGITFFGAETVQVVKPYAVGAIMRLRGGQKIFHGIPGEKDDNDKEQDRDKGRRSSTASTTFTSGNDISLGNEVVMLGVLSAAKDSVEREKVCHKQICHWRAMLALLTEDMIDGNGAHSGSIPKAPVTVAPNI
jgi:hypothetical protein